MSRGIFTHFLEENLEAPCELGATQFTIKKDAEKYFMSKLSTLTNNIDETLKCLYKYASNYKTRHILVTLGGDYAFKYAEAHFNFIERLMVLLHGKTFKLENGKVM